MITEESSRLSNVMKSAHWSINTDQARLLANSSRLKVLSFYLPNHSWSGLVRRTYSCCEKHRDFISSIDTKVVAMSWSLTGCLIIDVKTESLA